MNLSLSSLWLLFLVLVTFFRGQQQQQQQGDALSSMASFNFMNCMDFARHMTSTAEKFGMISSAETAAAAAAVGRRRIDQRFVNAVIPEGLVDRMFGQYHHNHQQNVRQSEVLGTFQTLFRQLLNIGDSNVAACNARPKLTACQNVDDNLSRYLPGWWFDLKVTDNANYVASQLTSSRYHALAESGMKAYKCFCQC